MKVQDLWIIRREYKTGMFYKDEFTWINDIVETEAFSSRSDALAKIYDEDIQNYEIVPLIDAYYDYYESFRVS